MTDTLFRDYLVVFCENHFGTFTRCIQALLSDYSQFLHCTFRVMQEMEQERLDLVRFIQQQKQKNKLKQAIGVYQKIRNSAVHCSDAIGREQQYLDSVIERSTCTFSSLIKTTVCKTVKLRITCFSQIYSIIVLFSSLGGWTSICLYFIHP